LLKSIARGVLRTGTGTAQVPHWLSRIVRRGLAEDPRMRYRDMHELLEALRRGPDGGELIDDEGRSGAGSSGALGRLLSSYRTGGSSDSAELEALVDEVARRLQLKRAGATNDEALRIGSNGGLAALPRQSALLLFVSVISTISAVFTLLLVGMMLRPATPVAVEPPPVAVDEGPLSMILEDVDAGNLGKAET